MTRVPAHFGRRQLLIAGALSVVALPVLASCATTEPPEQTDALKALLARAQADVQLTKATATTHPSLSQASNIIASDRQQHVDALRKELERVSGRTTSHSAAPTTTSTAPKPADQPSVALNQLREALTAAEREATDAITSVTAYRAGLVGSIAASCACLREVVS